MPQTERPAVELKAAESMAALTIENPIVNKLRAAGKNALKYASFAGATLVLASCRSNSTQNQIQARITADLGPQVAAQVMARIQKTAATRDSDAPDYMEMCLSSLKKSPASFYRTMGLLKDRGVSDRERAQLLTQYASAPTLEGATVADLAKISFSSAHKRLMRVPTAGSGEYKFLANLDNGAHVSMTYSRSRDSRAYRKRPTEFSIFHPRFEEFGSPSDVGVDEKQAIPNYQIRPFERWFGLTVSFASKTQRALRCDPGLRRKSR